MANWKQQTSAYLQPFHSIRTCSFHYQVDKRLLFTWFFSSAKYWLLKNENAAFVFSHSAQNVSIWQRLYQIVYQQQQQQPKPQKLALFVRLRNILIKWCRHAVWEFDVCDRNRIFKVSIKWPGCPYSSARCNLRFSLFTNNEHNNKQQCKHLPNYMDLVRLCCRTTHDARVPKSLPT